MCWRRPEREDGDVVSKRDQSQACRDRGIFMDRLQVARTFRPRELQSHVRSAFREDAEGDAFRHEAHALRRIQDDRRSLSSFGIALGTGKAIWLS
jgi:hypothetical protein